MNDDRLLKLSLMTACIGIFALFGILEFSSVRMYSVEEVIDIDDNEDIVMHAKVENVKESKKVVSFNIIEVRKIKQKALYFKEKDVDSGINTGDYIRIEGSKYNGNVIVDKYEIDP